MSVTRNNCAGVTSYIPLNLSICFAFLEQLLCTRRVNDVVHAKEGLSTGYVGSFLKENKAKRLAEHAAGVPHVADYYLWT